MSGRYSCEIPLTPSPQGFAEVMRDIQERAAKVPHVVRFLVGPGATDSMRTGIPVKLAPSLAGYLGGTPVIESALLEAGSIYAEWSDGRIERLDKRSEARP